MSNGSDGRTGDMRTSEKTPLNISLAFGECLEGCGIKRAIANLDKLLNQEPHEAFNEIIPSKNAFQRFRERFPFAVHKTMTRRQWTYNRSAIENTLPEWKEIIREYYNTTFVPSVRM